MSFDAENEAEDFDMDFDFGELPTTLRPENEGASRVSQNPVKVVLHGETVVPYEEPKNNEKSEGSAEKVEGPRAGSVLYFDIETIPDYDRQHLFGLPPLPVVIEEQQLCELMEPAEFLSQTAKEIDVWFSKNNPCEEWIAQLEEVERKTTGRSGNRKGVFDLLDKARGNKDAVGDAMRANRKKMSVTPEMCRIVSMSFAVDDDQVVSLVDGIDGVTEQDMLATFWAIARKVQHFCGFNVSNFDLPSIFFRSIILGIPASRMIDLSPYKNQVIDLMVSRFGRNGERGMGLKNVAKLCDIQIPCEGVDGSQVEELWKQNPALVGEYCASDVIVTRKLHRLYSGFFCI